MFEGRNYRSYKCFNYCSTLTMIAFLKIFNCRNSGCVRDKNLSLALNDSSCYFTYIPHFMKISKAEVKISTKIGTFQNE